MAAENELVHSSSLFQRHGNPIVFYMRPCDARVRLKPLIEHGGGKISSKLIQDAIKLAEVGSKVSSDDYISAKYIEECVKKNRLLGTEKYRVRSGQTVMESDPDDSFNDSISPASVVVTAAPNCKGRSKYTLEEDVAMISYIMTEQKYHLVSGIKLFKDMEDLKITGHPAQSMNTRFRKNILPNINKYKLEIPAHWISKLTGNITQEKEPEFSFDDLYKRSVTGLKLGKTSAKESTEGKTSERKHTPPPGAQGATASRQHNVSSSIVQKYKSMISKIASNKTTKQPSTSREVVASGKGDVATEGKTVGAATPKKAVDARSLLQKVTVELVPVEQELKKAGQSPRHNSSSGGMSRLTHSTTGSSAGSKSPVKQSKTQTPVTGSPVRSVQKSVGATTNSSSPKPVGGRSVEEVSVEEHREGEAAGMKRNLRSSQVGIVNGADRNAAVEMAVDAASDLPKIERRRKVPLEFKDSDAPRSLRTGSKSSKYADDTGGEDNQSEPSVYALSDGRLREGSESSDFSKDNSDSLDEQLCMASNQKQNISNTGNQDSAACKHIDRPSETGSNDETVKDKNVATSAVVDQQVVVSSGDTGEPGDQSPGGSDSTDSDSFDNMLLHRVNFTPRKKLNVLEDSDSDIGRVPDTDRQQTEHGQVKRQLRSRQHCNKKLRGEHTQAPAQSLHKGECQKSKRGMNRNKKGSLHSGSDSSTDSDGVHAQVASCQPSTSKTVARRPRRRRGVNRHLRGMEIDSSEDSDIEAENSQSSRTGVIAGTSGSDQAYDFSASTMEEEVQQCKKAYMAVARRYGVEPGYVWQCLYASSGDLERAVKYIKYGQHARAVYPPLWTASDDEAVYDSEEFYRLVARYGRKDVHQRLKFLQGL